MYKQKVKHLLYEHQNNVEALKLGTEVAVKDAENACSSQQAALAEDKAILKQRLQQQVFSKYRLPLLEGRSQTG